MEKHKSNKSEIIEIFAQFFIVFSALSYNIEILSKEVLFIIGISILMILVFKKIILNEGFTIYRIDIWWLFFMLIFLFNRDPNYAEFATYYLILGLLSMFLFRENARSYIGTFAAIFLFTTLNLFANLLSIVSFSYFNNVINLLHISVFTDDYSNLTGLFSDIGRNAYAAIVGFSASFSLLFTKYKKHNILLWIFSILMLLIVISTGKLGHTLFLLVSIGLLLMFVEKSAEQRIKKLFYLFILLGFILGLAYILVPQTEMILNRTFSKLSNGDISSGRFNVWRIAYEIFLKNPLWGIGYGSFTVNSLNYTDIAIYAGVHNDYLQWLVETGVIGFIVNMLILIGIYSLSIRMFKIIAYHEKTYSFRKALILWSIFFQTFVILYSLTGTPHFSYEVNNIYLISCGVPFALINQIELKELKYHVILKIRTSNSR